MRLLLLTRYGVLGASSRMRTYQYVPDLLHAGFAVTTRALLPDVYLERQYAGKPPGVALVARSYLRRVLDVLRATRFDLVWLEKELLPWVPGPVEQLLLANVPYVVDYDDAIFHTYDRHPSRVVRAAFAGKVAGLMRRARLVVAGNEYLRAHATRAGARRTAVLPTAVDLSRYAARDWPADGRPFTIGWIGSPSTTRYLREVAPVLAGAAARGTRVVLVGAHPGTPLGFPCEHRPWSEATEAAEIRAFDVGIMPIPDEPWARGKCGYKLIQYMACGVPVVASPVGVNRDIVEPGRNGFLASDGHAWSSAFETLRADVALRERLGAAGRLKVAARYCTAVVGPALADLVVSAADAPRANRRGDEQEPAANRVASPECDRRRAR